MFHIFDLYVDLDSSLLVFFPPKQLLRRWVATAVLGPRKPWTRNAQSPGAELGTDGDCLAGHGTVTRLRTVFFCSFNRPSHQLTFAATIQTKVGDLQAIRHQSWRNGMLNMAQFTEQWARLDHWRLNCQKPSCMMLYVQVNEIEQKQARGMCSFSDMFSVDWKTSIYSFEVCRREVTGQGLTAGLRDSGYLMNPVSYVIALREFHFRVWRIWLIVKMSSCYGASL